MKTHRSLSGLISALIVLSAPLRGWSQPSPTPRTDHSAAWDAARGQLVLFGGSDGISPNDETWVWNGSWTLKNPTNRPSARANASMVYDEARQQVLLFGGSEDTFSGLIDTWVWDGIDWSERFITNPPPARFSHGMAYDASRQEIVLFGGYDSGGYLNDTWVWTGTNWLSRNPATSPSVRSVRQGMAYDGQRQEIILFGGELPGGVQTNDTWAWNGTNWNVRSPATAPAARQAQALAYDDARKQITLFGGSSLNDTWVWYGTNWVQQSPQQVPPPRLGHTLTFDPPRQSLVLFGGIKVPEQIPYGDMWLWNGTNWQQTPALFSDRFEDPTLDPFWSTYANAGTIVFPATNVTHGGTQSVALSSFANAGQKSIGLFHDFAIPIYGRVSIWVYDSGADEASGNFIGFHIRNKAQNRSAGIFTQDYDSGPSSGGNYYYETFDNPSLNSSVDRTKAWRKFTIIATEQTLTLQVDGVTIHSGPGGVPFDRVEFEIHGPTWRPALTVYFDDFEAMEMSGEPLRGHIYWSTAGDILIGGADSQIRRARLDGSGVETVLTNDTGIPFSGIAIDALNGLLYSGNGNGLFRANLDGTGQTVLITNTAVYDLELDLAAGKIYWSDTNSIHRANLDGSGPETILPNIGFCQGLALDPLKQKIYFNNSTNLRVAGFDGNGLTNFVVLGAGAQPFDVEIDPASRKLYWNELWSGAVTNQRVQSASLDGPPNVQTVLQPARTNANGICFDEFSRKLYFSDTVTNGNGPLKLNRIDADGSGLEFLLSDSGRFNYIAVIPEPISADLSIAGSLFPASPEVGGPATYILNVFNNGPGTATGVTVTNVLPASVTNVSATVSVGTCTNQNGTVICDLGSLTSGGTAIVSIAFNPLSAGSITNTSAVAALSFDPSPANNSTTNISPVRPASLGADLAVSQSVSTNSIAVGSNVTFTITVTNRGPDNAFGAVVTDMLPDNVIFVNAFSTRGTPVQSGQVVTTDLGTLTNGTAATIFVTFKSLLSGSLTNLAQVSSGTPDPDSANNFSLAWLTLNGSPGNASWHFETIPGLPADIALGQVWARARGEAYVWGSRTTPGTANAFLFRWNGANWIQILDFPGGQPEWIFGVGASDVFLSLRDTAQNRSRVFRSTDNGQTFIEHVLPVEAINNELRNFAGTPNNVHMGTVGGNIIRFDGGSWNTIYTNRAEDVSALTMPGPAEGYYVTCWGWGYWNGISWQFNGRQFDFCDISATWAIRDSGGALHWYAVGDNNFADGVRVWKFDETSQSFVGKTNTVEADGTGVNVGGANGIWGSAADDVYVTGNLASQSGGVRGGRIYHYDGLTWSRLASLEPLPPISGITGTARDDIWVALADGRLLHLAPLDPTSPPSILTPAQNIAVPQGQTAAFEVNATGTPPLSYQWYFGGTNTIAGQTNATLLLPNAQLTNAGTYSVVVNNAFGAATNSATLAVIDPGQLQQLVITNSTSVTLDSGMAGAFQFQWRLNGANIVGATNATYVVPVIVTSTNASGGGRYSVVVMTGFGSIVRDIAEIVVQPPAPVGDNFANRPTLTLPGGFEIRSGSNTLATREAGEPLHAGKPGTHSVWYKWTPTADGIAEFNTFGSAFDTLLAVYTGTTVSNLQVIADNDDDFPFLTSRVRFSALTGTEYQIAVDGHGEESGTFLLLGQFTQTPNVVPSITGHPTNRTVLPDASVTFSVNAQPATLIYQWYFNGIALVGETGGALTIPSVQPTNVGHYAVQITNQLGGQSVLSKTATLELGPQPGVQSFDKLEDLIQASGNITSESLQSGRLQKDGPVTSIGFLSVSAGLPVSQLLNNVTDSATQTRDPLPCGIIGSASRWLGLEAAGDGFIRLDTQGSSNAVSLAVYRLVPGYETSSNTLVKCDLGSGLDFSSVQFPTTNGALYLVEVDSAQDEKGLIQLTCRLGLPPWRTGDPPDWANVPTNVVYSAGDDITLIAPDETDGVDPSSYQWFREGYRLGTARELSLRGLQPTDAGLYSVMVSNYFGSLTYQVALLHVDVPLQFLGIGLAPDDTIDLDVAGNFGQGFVVEAATEATNFFPGGVIDLKTSRLLKNIQTVTVTNTIPADRLFYRLRSQ